MSEVSYSGTIEAECRLQIIICGERIELRRGIGWFPSKRHIATIFSQHYSVSGARLYGMGPLQLPHRQICISVEAEKNAGRTPRVANDETREELAIGSA